MKIELDASALAEALALVGKVVDKGTGNAQAVLGCIRLEARAGRLHLAGTDLTNALTTSVPADVKVPGYALVSRETLGKLAPTWSGTLTLETDAEWWLSVHGVGSEARLPGVPVDDYPVLPERPKAGVVVPGAGLASILRRTIFVPRRLTKMRFSWNFLQIDLSDGRLMATSTDGHTASRATVVIEDHKATLSRVLLSLRAAELLIEMASDVDQIHLARDGSDASGRVHAWTDSVHLAAQTPEGNGMPAGIDKFLTLPPDYNHVRLQRADAIAAIKRLLVVTPTTSDGKRGALRCTVTPGSMELASQSEGRGRVVERLACDADKPVASIGMAVAYLSDFFSAADGDAVTVALPGDGESNVFLWPDGRREEHVYLVAPMRL
jgi:DNA polymerase III sliding clamp (beta) subunit (PCNA family)